MTRASRERAVTIQRRRAVDGTGDAQRLVVIDIVSAAGVVILQAIWAPAADLTFGRRVTCGEMIADREQLMDRLAGLVPHLDLPAARAAGVTPLRRAVG